MMQATEWKKLQNGSDIRGVALEGVAGESVNLTPAVVATLGKSFVLWLAQKRNRPLTQLTISVGRDSRLTGPILLDAIATSMSELGCRVYNVEMASTPAMFMSTVTPGFECDGAIMLTASHLPFNRNGLKFFTPEGGLEKQDIATLLDIATADQFPTASVPGTLETQNFISVYTQQLVEKIRAGVQHPTNFEHPLQGLKIVVDAGNGAGGFFVDQVLRPLGADTTGSQFLAPDGNFPNHVPNPEHPTAMAAICQAVNEHQADFGIIFDTDVDRAAAVDSAGNELNRNKLIALIAAIILREHPGSAIVTDSITSDGLTTFIEAQGGVHHRFRRGYKNVINEAIRLNQSGQPSWLAIETSGHGALKENYFLDDGAYLVSKLLIELAKAKLAGQSLTDLIATLPEPAESQEFRLLIQTNDFASYGKGVIDQLQAFAQTQDGWQIVPKNYEGVRVACQSPEEKGWFLLRLSLHDPVLPLNIESNIEGGILQIKQKLIGFFETFQDLDLSALT